MVQEGIRVLSEIVTPRRLERMKTVLAGRTRYVTVVLEDVYQPHNASAVLRSCDSFGVQDVHVVEKQNRYTVNPSIELGTSQWLDIERYDSVDRCVGALRSRGYRIVATTPHGVTTQLCDFAIERSPTALLFGTELTGLTAEAVALADERLAIPMVGFVESLNISVSAAIIVNDLTTRLRRADVPWQLSADESAEILFRWLRGSVREADEHLRRAGIEV